MKSPVAVFAYNRKASFENLISSLQRNPESRDTDLVIFVDGPRGEKDAADVAAVRESASSVSGFKSVRLRFREVNKGLARSIIDGVTEVISEYGRVIVLEDDLEVSRGFLAYMNRMLDIYESDSRVMQIAGFGTKVTPPAHYPYDVYLNRRAESWSWATWKDRWSQVDWDVKDYREFERSLSLRLSFASVGSDLPGMLRDWHEGRNSSWAVRFCWSMFRQRRFCISPLKSLVKNSGFGEGATHCKGYDRYKSDFNDTQENFHALAGVPFVAKLDRKANRYWSIPYRVYGKLRSIVKI